MAKIVSVEQMRRIERAADAGGWSYDEMMLRAGAAVAAEVIRLRGDGRGRRVVVLVGTGNNGGDGLVAGARLLEAGYDVEAFTLRPRTDAHARTFAELGGKVIAANEEQGLASLERSLASAEVLLDAVLGTGFTLPLKEEVARLLARVGAAIDGRRPPLVLAVDCPSGLDCDSGAVAPQALAVDVTVTLAAVKPGLVRFPGAARVGRIVVGDIGLRPGMKEVSEVRIEYAQASDVRGWLPARPPQAHKGTFGRALIVAGSVNYPGSVGLAGEAAYRVGVGLVTLAVPGAIHGALIPFLPEATWLVLPQETGVIAEPAAEVVRAAAEGAEAVAIGPGFGREATTRKFLVRLLQSGEAGGKGRVGFVRGPERHPEGGGSLPPLVIDADALRLLSEIEGWAKLLPPGSVLTPHPGEMAAMTGLTVDTIQANREGVARERATEWGHIVVLKGAHTVVASPDGRAWVLPFASAALAKAGTGDVLTGAIVGLRAQGVGATEAAVLGSFVHGRAGTLVAEEAGTTAGVLASEVARRLPAAIAELEAGS